ncbi:MULTISPECIES: ZIP family metal transporter [Cellulophaga]|uniref:Zinc/iron permease n=1 Tax=Cellulophaga lytica (strain ATCC 23178 / DSM 7489 / JCM 8516 / NBRC 14961 / NCIMB 1423 / VKM B-1433 / Cy l20) TaxID=867900 RepID=F0RH32_CELLC|nr:MULTISPECIES: ZIP family metal transporter [Cellulophaga]ADY28070.1 zinc/iron permease [Cellulophaga lytica DSM 7489]AIM59145.1 ZIP family metal transporter [Cellulophaga lytica]APU08953.1 ZIP family metal transporter [Cellulophaga lytica]MDO6855144.1 ZIP family metal transporter [Cellulophaga lytica]TVZ09360.1 ZIP zinc transporter [Cellulophaga sp. RHA_52]
MIYILPILGVLLSFIFVYVTKPKNKEIFKLLLAFSGAFLLAITVFELFPEVYEHGDPKQVGVFIMLGILLQIFLEFFSKGAEHGHVHLNIDSVNLPWMLFISLSIHSLLEGMPLGHHHNHNFVYGILVHKIPIAIILSIFLLNSKIKLAQAVLFITLFAFMTPLGSLLSSNLTFLKTYHIQITALVIGVLLHISTVILFESSEGHKFNLRKLLVIIFGIAIAYFI